MVVARNSENDPLIQPGAVLAVGEYHDGLAIWRIRNDEVAEGVVGSPVPQHFSVLVPLYSPAKTPGQGAVEPHFRCGHGPPDFRREREPGPVARGNHAAQEAGVI